MLDYPENDAQANGRRRPMRIMLLGADGLLGTAVQETAATHPHVQQLTALGHSDLDITRPEQVNAAIEKTRPDAVINTAALMPADRCDEVPHGGLCRQRTRPALHQPGMRKRWRDSGVRDHRFRLRRHRDRPVSAGNAPPPPADLRRHQAGGRARDQVGLGPPPRRAHVVPVRPAAAQPAGAGQLRRPRARPGDGRMGT